MLQNEQTIDLMEKGVIASIIDDHDILGVVSEMLYPEDYQDPKHQAIYAKILEFYRSNVNIDAIAIIESIINDGNANLGITAEYFIDLFDKISLSSNQDPVYYADRIKENSLKRRLNNFGQEVSSLASPGSGTSSESIVAKMQSVVQYYSELSYGSESVSLESFGDDVMLDLEDRFKNGDTASKFIPTGFYDLDNRLGGGLAPGQMGIIAGRPGMGKTTLALDFARNAAFLSNKSVLFFSLEMSKEELMHKILSAESHVKHKKIRGATDLNADEWTKMYEAMAKIRSSHFYVDDSPNLDMATLIAKCKKHKLRPEGLDIVFIDYLQLMKMPNSRENREKEISEVSRSIKLAAKELEIPIVILAQLNRGNVNRTEKRPMVSDLRESGSLEQDADLVILVHRPSEYDPNEKPGITEIILGKVRAGEQGIVDTISLLEYSKFANAQGVYQSSENIPSSDDDMPSHDSETGEVIEFDSSPPPVENNIEYDNPPYPLNENIPSGENPDSGGSAW